MLKLKDPSANAMPMHLTFAVVVEGEVEVEFVCKTKVLPLEINFNLHTPEIPGIE